MKLEAEKITGVELTVDIKPEDNKVDAMAFYASSFLTIFNTVRETEGLYKVMNYAGTNLVSVLCEEDIAERFGKWLSQFGEVREPETVNIYLVEGGEIEYDEECHENYVIGI